MRLGSILTGLIFTLIVTRELSQEEFGTWGLMGGLILYVTIIEPIISYWATRDIARGIEAGKTAVLSSGLFSIAGLGGYIVIVYLVSLQSNVDTDALLFASILLPMMFFNYTLNAVNLGWRPQAISYGFIIFEIVKIPFGFLFIYFMQLGIYGAILSSFIAYIASNVALLYFTREKLKEKFQLTILKKWLKISWLPLYRNIFPIIAYSDVVIFSLVTGSVLGIAYITSARAISGLVSYTQSFSQALYPKLLESGKREYLQENLVRLLYFAIPLFCFSIVFARPGLFVLNPIYEGAVPIVIFFSLRALLSTLNKTFYSSVQGIDDVDVKENSSIKNYLKSRLFLIPTLRIVQYGLLSISLIVGLMILINQNTSQLDLAMFLSIIAMIIEIPFTIHSFLIVKREFPLKLDYGAILKYCMISFIVSIFIFFIMDEFIKYEKSLFIFLPSLLPFIVMFIIMYFGLTYLIDQRTKILCKSIISELSGINKQNNKNGSE